MYDDDARRRPQIYVTGGRPDYTPPHPAQVRTRRTSFESGDSDGPHIIFVYIYVCRERERASPLETCHFLFLSFSRYFICFLFLLLSHAYTARLHVCITAADRHSCTLLCFVFFSVPSYDSERRTLHRKKNYYLLRTVVNRARRSDDMYYPIRLCSVGSNAQDRNVRSEKEKRKTRETHT